MKWVRVTRANKCPICNKGDWCCIGEKWINCMRVQSPRDCENGGWLHPLNGVTTPVTPVKYEAPRPTLNATKLMRDWRLQTEPEAVQEFAKSIGVDSQALEAIGAAWAPEYQAWAFPMKDGHSNVIGVRLRDMNGRKWAVTGSRAGLFFDRPPTGLACVCEGPTDTSAALSIGLSPVGRPSCIGSEPDLLIALKNSARVLLIADNDTPGWNGALRLQQQLKVPSLIWSPPAKDLRDFVRLGGSLNLILSLTKSMVWRCA